MNSKAVTAMFTVLIACGLNNVFLEYIIKLDPGCGHLITFLQFVFVAFHGLIFFSKFGAVEPKVPRKNYLVLVALFFITSVVNNWAFDFNIPVPLHMIFRAGSLIANMIMGILILKKKYPLEKYISIFMITSGIVICTLYSSKQLPKACTDCDITTKGMEPVNQESVDQAQFFWWVIGILLLTGALLLSARMGIYQEHIFSKYGKHPEEGLFYTHMYSLPLFILYTPSIWEHGRLAVNSELYDVPFINIALPITVVYLILNVLTQYLCISSVYVLTTECTSLTVTLIITLRKFLSLIFSIVYFQNPFTIVHWFGTILVFVGTLLFAEVPRRIKEEVAKYKVKTN